MNVSIALASYNGEKYIEEQINSIVTQLSSSDEIIISDDGSTDQTIDIINRLAKSYPQIKLIEGPKQGVIKNFENAIFHCKNDIIFLSDQDDIWNPNKIERVMTIFENNNVELVLHNMDYCGEISKTGIIKYKKGVLHNIIKSGYWGCCMAFTKNLKDKILPFNNNICAHDQWIGIVSEMEDKTYFLDESLIQHRTHEKNLTNSLTIWNKIQFRIDTIKSIKWELVNYFLSELPIVILFLFVFVPFDSRFLYVIYFSLFLIYSIYIFKKNGIKNTIQEIKDKYSYFSIALIIIWLYGVILGIIKGNNLKYIAMNFAGMTLYSAFFMFKAYEPTFSRIKKIIINAGVFCMVLTMIVYICEVQYYTIMHDIIIMIPIIGSYAGGGNNILYSTQLVLFCVIGLSANDLLYKKNVTKNLIISVLGFITVFIGIKQGGFQLAYLATILLVVLFYIKNRISFFSIHKWFYLTSIFACVIVIMLFSFYTNGILYRIFDVNDIGNSFRIEQLILGIKDCNFFGNGLGATFSTGVIVFPLQPYGIEITYLNILHKFGFLSVFIVLSYLVVYIKAYSINNMNSNSYTLFCIFLISFVFPSLGNPYLFHPISVILHSLSMYFLFSKESEIIC